MKLNEFTLPKTLAICDMPNVNLYLTSFFANVIFSLENPLLLQTATWKQSNFRFYNNEITFLKTLLQTEGQNIDNYYLVGILLNNLVLELLFYLFDLILQNG